MEITVYLLRHPIRAWYLPTQVMQSQEVSAGSQNTVDAQLQSSSVSLNEVVVIGYGTVRKSDLTGAISTVKGDKLMDKPAPNISQALEGKVAGVDVSINSNAPGQGAKVRIRGIGSINSNIDPLYVGRWCDRL